ncbi:Adenosine deaminase, partial [Dysosmobacter welbionis]
MKLVALLVGQGQNHLHLGRHGEALGGVPVGVQGAVLEGQLLNSVGVGQQDGVEVLNGVLHVLDLVDELVSSLGEVDGLDLTDIAVSVILDLEPLALSHLTLVLGGVADPLQGVADLGDLHELAVDDHLAGPGPLGLIVVSLAVHVAAGDIDVVGGGALVLADGDSGDHIAVIIVKGVDLGVGSNVGVGILIGLHVLEVLHHQVDVLHAGGDGLHIVHDLTILAARAASGILDLNVLQLHVQVDGVVVAVDVAAVVGGLQGHVLLIDGSAIAAHILGILGHIGVIVDDVLGGGHSHFLQGIHVVVVDRVGAPGVQLRQVLASGVDVALGHVHGDGIH